MTSTRRFKIYEKLSPNKRKKICKTTVRITDSRLVFDSSEIRSIPFEKINTYKDSLTKLDDPGEMLSGLSFMIEYLDSTANKKTLLLYDAGWLGGDEKDFQNFLKPLRNAFAQKQNSGNADDLNQYYGSYSAPTFGRDGLYVLSGMFTFFAVLFSTDSENPLIQWYSVLPAMIMSTFIILYLTWRKINLSDSALTVSRRFRTRIVSWDSITKIVRLIGSPSNKGRVSYLIYYSNGSTQKIIAFLESNMKPEHLRKVLRVIKTKVPPAFQFKGRENTWSKPIESSFTPWPVDNTW